MLNITFNGEDKEAVMTTLIEELSKTILDLSVQTLVADYFDSEEERHEALKELIADDNEGFIFDEENKLGEETYGYVSDFFDSYVSVIEKLKKTFPKIGIEGDILVNEYGTMDWVHQNGVYATSNMKSVRLCKQLQCVMCYDWVNPKDAACEVDEDFDFSQLDGDFDTENMPEAISMAWNNTTEGELRTCMCKNCQANIEVDFD